MRLSAKRRERTNDVKFEWIGPQSPVPIHAPLSPWQLLSTCKTVFYSPDFRPRQPKRPRSSSYSPLPLPIALPEPQAPASPPHSPVSPQRQQQDSPLSPSATPRTPLSLAAPSFWDESQLSGPSLELSQSFLPRSPLLNPPKTASPTVASSSRSASFSSSPSRSPSSPKTPPPFPSPSPAPSPSSSFSSLSSSSSFDSPSSSPSSSSSVSQSSSSSSSPSPSALTPPQVQEQPVTTIEDLITSVKPKKKSRLAQQSPVWQAKQRAQTKTTHRPQHSDSEEDSDEDSDDPPVRRRQQVRSVVRPLLVPASTAIVRPAPSTPPSPTPPAIATSTNGVVVEPAPEARPLGERQSSWSARILGFVASSLPFRPPTTTTTGPQPSTESDKENDSEGSESEGHENVKDRAGEKASHDDDGPNAELGERSSSFSDESSSSKLGDLLVPEDELLFQSGDVGDDEDGDVVIDGPEEDDEHDESSGQLYSREDEALLETDSDEEEDEEELFLNVWQILQHVKKIPRERLLQCAPERRPLPAKDPSLPLHTLVLDLDETLLHSSVSQISKADFVFQIPASPALASPPMIWVRLRPGLHQFLETVSLLFEVVIFTASHEAYAAPLLDLIEQQADHPWIHHRLFRSSCLQVDDLYFKELGILNRPLSNVVIIDNSPSAFTLNIENGIPIRSWYSDQKDTCLLDMLPFLKSLTNVQDVRGPLEQRFKVKHEIDRIGAAYKSTYDDDDDDS